MDSDRTPSDGSPPHGGSRPGGAPSARSAVVDPFRLNRAIRVAAVVSLAIGGFYFAAWMAGAAAGWGAHAITVKANASVALILAGAALLLSTLPPTRRRDAARALASAIVLLIGLLTLCEHLLRVDLRIDQLIATEPPGALGTASPNRMGPPASLSLMLLGAGLLATRSRWRAWQYLGLATLLVAIVPAIGYLYQIGLFYSEARVTGIAWPAVIAISSLAIGLMLWHPLRGPVPLLWRDDPGGALLRRVWPATVVVPLVFGLLRVTGERYGLYERTVGTGLFVISVTLFFSALLWGSAAKLSASARRRQETEDALRESNERLREADRRKDEFLSAASHELRTPLATLRLHTEMLSRALAGASADGERLRRTVPRLEAQLERLERLVSSLLDASRIAAGRLRLDLEQVDLAEVTAAAAERFDEAAERSGTKLVVRASPAVGRWDRLRLDQVVTNLVDNALKFAPGAPVELGVELRDAHAVLTVRDHGPGIPLGSTERIFEQYERAADARTFSGLGLGLWIARQIVEAHGGAISVESGPGAGSTFTVRLPLGAR